MNNFKEYYNEINESNKKPHMFGEIISSNDVDKDLFKVVDKFINVWKTTIEFYPNKKSGGVYIFHLDDGFIFYSKDLMRLSKEKYFKSFEQTDERKCELKFMI